jgi:hypothetical protein
VSQRDPASFRSRSCSRSRLTFNEQLCLFAQGNDAVVTRASFGWWATLALALAVVPWALVGVMIWLFA